jgi:hypothetical protein
MNSMTFFLHPQKITPHILLELERRGRIKRLSPTQAILQAPHTDNVDALYTADPRSGAHKLICVRKNQTEITLTAHTDNEEVIFLKDPGATFKPLYLIISQLSEQELRQKHAAKSLEKDDILALEVVYNDPQTLFFSIIKDTPHCEITIEGDHPAPIFFVTEPADISMRYIEFQDLSIKIKK